MNLSSPELLIMLVLGSLFCIVMEVTKINRDKNGKTIKAIKRKKKNPLSIGLTVIIVIILLFVTSSGCMDEDTEPEIEIIHPEETVEWQEKIGGTAKNMPDGYELWILAYSKEKQEYYPITEAATKYDEWTTQVPIGLENDDGKKYDIIAVLADKKAQDRFNAHISSIKENEDAYSQCIYVIPDGAKEYDRITVTREKWSLL